jgi:hypothetical protein
MVAVWAEADLVVADQFQDGNVPSKQEPLTCAKLAFEALPSTITQRYYQTLAGGQLLNWHREKAGTVEHVHDEVKNELGGSHVPSQRFGVNSAWFKIALLSYNIISAIKGLCLGEEERTARLKRFRLLVIHVAGRMNRNNCVMGLRVCNNTEALQRMQKVWKVFELPTQATSAKPLGRRGS